MKKYIKYIGMLAIMMIGIIGLGVNSLASDNIDSHVKITQNNKSWVINNLSNDGVNITVVLGSGDEVETTTITLDPKSHYEIISKSGQKMKLFINENNTSNEVYSGIMLDIRDVIAIIGVLLLVVIGVVLLGLNYST